METLVTTYPQIRFNLFKDIHSLLFLIFFLFYFYKLFCFNKLLPLYADFLDQFDGGISKSIKGKLNCHMNKRGMRCVRVYRDIRCRKKKLQA